MSLGKVEYVIRGPGGPYRAEFHFNSVEELAKLIDLSTLLSVDEIVECIFNELVDEDIKEMAGFTFDQLIQLHSTMGTDIRNTFGLWIENNPNVEHHPDDTSMDIMKLLWEKCKNAAQAGAQVMTF